MRASPLGASCAGKFRQRDVAGTVVLALGFGDLRHSHPRHGTVQKNRMSGTAKSLGPGFRRDDEMRGYRLERKLKRAVLKSVAMDGASIPG